MAQPGLNRRAVPSQYRQAVRAWIETQVAPAAKRWLAGLDTNSPTWLDAPPRHDVDLDAVGFKLRFIHTPTCAAGWHPSPADWDTRISHSDRSAEPSLRRTLAIRRSDFLPRRTTRPVGEAALAFLGRAQHNKCRGLASSFSMTIDSWYACHFGMFVHILPVQPVVMLLPMTEMSCPPRFRMACADAARAVSALPVRWPSRCRPLHRSMILSLPVIQLSLAIQAQTQCQL